MSSTDQSPLPNRPARPFRSRLKRFAMLSACLLVGVAIAGELASRYILGLGDPPLYRLDPDIEYELVPSRSYTRFGNSYRVNAYSMRSDPFPALKPFEGELRVMVLGDSIVNAGGRVDQADLATDKLPMLLINELKRPVVVGNMSAGSWGPMNELAFVKKHGVFDADVLILVLNSHDDDDVPGLEVIGPQWPQHTPVLALEELISNYVVRAVQRTLGSPAAAPARSAEQRELDIAASKQAFIDLVALLRARNVKVGVIQHAARTELGGTFDPGHATIAEWAKQQDVPVWQLAPLLSAVPGGPDAAYLPGDTAHLSAKGQAALAELLNKATLELLRKEPKQSP